MTIYLCRRSLHKKHLKGNTEVSDALGELEHPMKNDSKAYTCVAYNEEDNMIDFMYFQTGEMAKTMAKYPEVVGMDTTYQVNRNNMHLVVFQAIDNHGNGRVVGYGFLRRETGDIVQEAIQQFKDANPTATANICTVLVDKDYREINGIRKVLPHVRVHLCHTHVMRQFKRHTGHVKNKKTLMKTLLKMSECGSKAEFEELYQKLKEESHSNHATLL